MLSDSSRYCLHADTFPFAGNPRGSCNAIGWLAGARAQSRSTCARTTGCPLSLPWTCGRDAISHHFNIHIYLRIIIVRVRIVSSFCCKSFVHFTAWLFIQTPRDYVSNVINRYKGFGWRRTGESDKPREKTGRGRRKGVTRGLVNNLFQEVI